MESSRSHHLASCLLYIIPINNFDIDSSKISRVYATSYFPRFQGNGVDDNNDELMMGKRREEIDKRRVVAWLIL